MLTNSTHEQKKINLFTFCSSITVFIFISCFFIYPGSYNLGFALLAIFTLVSLFFKPAIYISKTTKKLITVYILYALIIALSISLDGGTLREFDRTSKYLIAIIILLGLLKFPPQKLLFYYAIAIASLSACLIAIYDVYFIKLERAFFNQMPIQMGDASMLFGLLSLAISCHYISSKKRLSALFFMAFLSGLAGSLLSISRGGWLLTPFIMSMIFYIYRDKISKKTLFRLISFAILGGGVILLILLYANTQVNESIKTALTEATRYFNGASSAAEQATQSVSIRLGLWHSAWHSFIDKPIFGWGLHGLVYSRELQFENGLISEPLHQLIGQIKPHAHNEYLNELALRGMIGLSTLLGLLCYPAYYFYKALRSPKNQAQYLSATMGLTFILSIAGFCLTQVYIGGHNSGAILMSAMTVILYALVENENRAEPSL